MKKNSRASVWALLALTAQLCLSSQLVHATTWVHPGVFIDQNQIDFIKSQIQAGKEPYVTWLNNAKTGQYGKTDYQLQGPPSDNIIQCGSYSNPDHGCTAAHSDTAAAYTQALLWAITGDAVYGDNAVKIMNAYAKGLKGYAGATPGFPCSGSCSNGPLQAAWDSTKMPRAAEIIRYANGGYSGWSAADIQAFTDMLKNVTVPSIYNGSPFNGNWEMSMIEGMMHIAVFTEDQELLDHARAFWKERVPAYFYNFELDGPNPAPFPPGRATSNGWNGQEIYSATTTGVMQETCRDLKHSEYGIASAMNAAETDFYQGGDLYTADGAQKRLVTAMNVAAGMELAGSKDAPADFCTDAGDKLTLGGVATYTVGYNHYHNRLHDPNMADASGTSGTWGTANTYNWIQKGVITQKTYTDEGAHMVIYEPLSHYGSPSEMKPGFFISATPSTTNVKPGETAHYQINMKTVGGYSQAISLNVASGLPTSTTATFTPEVLDAAHNIADLALQTSSNTETGNYPVSVIASDGVLKASANLFLLVSTSDQNIVITADDLSMTYGEVVPAVTYHVTPNMSLTTNPVCTTVATSKSAPGVYPTTCRGAAKEGYFISYINGKLTIKALRATITPRKKRIKLGEVIPTKFKYRVQPSVKLSAEPTCTTTATSSSPVGDYPITCSGAQAAGYEFDYVNGVLTIK